MSDIVAVMKDENDQQSIPSVWRKTFFDIVEALKEKDYGLAKKIDGVLPVSEEIAEYMAESVNDYGAVLLSLPEDTWKTSVCFWMGKHWDVMVDLYVEDEGASDLIMKASVYEKDNSYIFEIESIYVP